MMICSINQASAVLMKGNVGAPDPGGNYDDSCEDDIVFIPVPDGLFFMIFLSFMYALLKFFRVRA